MLCDEISYRQHDLHVMQGITHRQVNYWDNKKKLLCPARNKTGKREYSFLDLIKASVIQRLRPYVSIQRMDGAMKAFDDLASKWQLPIRKLNILIDHPKNPRIIFYSEDLLMNFYPKIDKGNDKVGDNVAIRDFINIRTDTLEAMIKGRADKLHPSTRKQLYSSPDVKPVYVDDTVPTDPTAF